MTIHLQKSQKARYNLDPESFFVNRFWGRRPDGVAINETLQIGYILEFQRSTDGDLAEGFLEVKEAEANDQHKSITGALKAAAASPEWEFEQINFVMCNRGLVVESNFHTKLKKLDVQEGKQNKLFADSAQSGECVLPPAGARRYEANYPRDRGRTWAQYARVRR